MHFSGIKEKAIQLRKEGYSYAYIIKYVPVTKSTLSEWLHDIPFIPNKYTLDTIKKAHLAAGEFKHQEKVNSLKRAENQARKDVSSLSDRDVLMLGIGIYIGEGGKTEGITRIINSDPKIIKFVLKWLNIVFGVQMNQIRIRLFLYPDCIEKECIEYWSKSVGIPTRQFFKSTIDTRTNKKISNKGKLPFGTAHVSVKSFGNKELGVYLHRRILALINRVLC